MDEQLKQSALDFHGFPAPGRVRVSPARPLATQRDLALAYSPDVVASCLEIEKDPLAAYKYTTRGNLVAVVSNGTAVLGLRNIDALAGKSVMGGKGVLFKRFANIDVFDVEISELDPNEPTNAVATPEPTLGDISLEDIKAPECLYVEQQLCGRMSIPVFHDDQHGTVITSTTVILNGLRVVKKNLSDMRMMASGAGAAAIACMNLLVALGMQKHNIVVCDSKGVIYKDREPNMTEAKVVYAVEDDDKRTFGDVINGADIFLGCPDPRVLTSEMMKKVARVSLILALVNPEPEIPPPLAKQIRDDVIICTGYSDYPNQVNNVLCFPFTLHDMLDVGATAINREMELAAMYIIAGLAHAEQSEVVTSAYGDQDSSFGSDYIIPKPFDLRLIVKTTPAMVKAAVGSGVVMRPVTDFDIYIEKLSEFIYKTNLLTKPISSQTRREPKRVVLVEGEGTRVLHVTQELVPLGLTRPVLVGHPSVIEMCIQRLGLQIKAGAGFEIVSSESSPRFKEYWDECYQLTKRHNITQEQARQTVISNTMVIGIIMAHRSEANAMVYETTGEYHNHYHAAQSLFGYRDGVSTAGAMNALLLPSGNASIADIYVNYGPSPEELAEITLMAAESVHRFGTGPWVALPSHFSSGSADRPSAGKMRKALELVRASAPELMIDGETYGDAVLAESIRNDHMPDGPSKGSANTLVMPNTETARISYSLLCASSSEGVIVGPVLMGVAKPAYTLTPIASVRRIMNMVVLVVVKAQTEPL